ncbi:MAG: hypothetical protein ACREA0_00265 [bacterium]
MRFPPSQSERVIFIHVPKAAGRTVHSIAARQYSRGEILPVEGRLGHTPPLSLEHAARAKIIIGLVDYGLHENLPGVSTYATMLREPVSRVLSLYRYIATNPRHYLHDQVTHKGLIDFVSESKNAEEIENVQTRQIAGTSEGSLDESSLRRARQNLMDSFCAVGLVERFDESIVLLKRRLRWKMPFFVRKNVGKELLSYEVTDEALRIIRARNMLDAELYAFARDLFIEQVRLEGPLFDAEVALFRTLNGAARLYRAGRELSRRAL